MTATAVALEKIVVVTRKTRLQELIERFNTVGQARFYIEHSGGDFKEYQSEDDTYRRSLERLQKQLDMGLKLQLIERTLVPTYLFSDKDVVITAGGDGLVANVAKYVGGQPIITVNVDPLRNDGVLLAFRPEQARLAVERVVSGFYRATAVTLAEAQTTDGQRLLAFNDFFIGARSHISARYVLTSCGARETQSSSGVIVSTGAGSTGWMSSVYNMMDGMVTFATRRRVEEVPRLEMAWDTPYLAWVVREPFRSRHSDASMVAGLISGDDDQLELQSLMPSGGCLFSDGIEDDYVAFNSGTTVKIGVAKQRAMLVSSAGMA
jgi:NAD kinase